MKIDWVGKLTSRKFWAAIVAFVTAILAFFSFPDGTVDKIISLVTAVSAMIAYIIGEGLVDAAYAKDKPPEE